MLRDLSNLGVQLKARFLKQALDSARQGRHRDAAASFDGCGVQPGEQVERGGDLAYSYYRRALLHQRDHEEPRAISDLEKAGKFPVVPDHLRSLIQRRLTAIRRDPRPEITEFDKATAKRFQKPPSTVELREEFLKRYGLSQANRQRKVDGIDEILSVGIYRWAGDPRRNERWSQLIREFKGGDPVLPVFFGRILAEHMRATSMGKEWLGEVDYIVPVPAGAARTAERGIDIVAQTGKHLSWQLGIPMHADFLRRRGHSKRSRSVGRADLASQYEFNENKAEEVRGRTVMLLDDVMNRGHTAGVCGTLLKKFGCARLVLLVLAQSESSLQSNRHAPEAGPAG